MSTAALDLIITLKDEASRGIGGVSKEVSALGKESERTHGIVSGLFTGIGFAAFNAGLTVVSSGFHALSGFIGDSIQESRDAAHGLAQTEAVIKSTGGAANVTAQQIVDLSGSLSHTTLFTDDAIQAQQNLLLTFTNVQNKAGEGNDIFTQASKVALDLAQAMGTDASGGAIQLGKALNSPKDGITALTRVGVTFTDQQKAQIKTLQESGNVMGAQKIILAELNKEFGGSAEAAAQADGGFHLFQQRLADVEQSVGDALQPALKQVMALLSGPVLDAVSSAATAFAGALPSAISYLTDTVIPAMVAGWQTIQPALAMAGDALTSLWNAVQVLVTGDFSGGIFGLDEDAPFIGFLLQAHDAMIDVLGVLDSLRYGLTSGDWLSAGEGISNFVEDIGTVFPVLQPVTDWLADTIPVAIDAAVAAFGIARDAVTTFIQALQGNWVDSSGILPLHQAVGELGLFITGTLVPAFQSFIAFVEANAQPILAGLGAMVVAVVVPAFVAWAAAAVASAAATIAALAPVVLPIAAIGVAVGLLYAAWQSDFGGIQTSLTAWWNGTGQPIFTQLRTWLAVTIPAAISVLAGFWTGTLQPALSAVWSFITGSVIPTLTTLATGAMVAVGTAATTLAGFWTGTLQPALNTVWSFIQNSIVPLFEALANVYIAALNLEVTAAAGFWQNVLYPALSTVWSFISSSLQPVISSLASFFSGTLNPAVTAAGNTLSTVLGPAITAVTGFFGSLYTAIGGISGAISTVIGWLNSLASRLNSLKLPDWLTPGSPTPFEWGLRGIADAAQLATKALDPLLAKANGMTAPNLSTPVEKASGGGPFSYQNGGGIDDAKQAGTDAGLKFGDGWKAGIEQIAPVLQDSTRLAFQQLHDVVLLPWQTMTNDFFSGAGFGFIGQASIGINSAGNGLATSAGNVGGAAGASLVSGLRGNLPGVVSFVGEVNAALAKIERDITIHVHTSYDGSGAAPTPPGRAVGGPVTAGMPYIVGERRPELFVPQTNGRILPSVPQSTRGGGDVNLTIDLSGADFGGSMSRADVVGIVKHVVDQATDSLKDVMIRNGQSYGVL